MFLSFFVVGWVKSACETVYMINHVSMSIKKSKKTNIDSCKSLVCIYNRYFYYGERINNLSFVIIQIFRLYQS